MEGAKEAVQRLNGYSMEGGHSLRVDRLVDRQARTSRGGNRGGQMGGRGGGDRNMMSGGGAGGMMGGHRHTEFPLRILVSSEMVGAIIGRQGATIRTITQQVRKRVGGNFINFRYFIEIYIVLFMTIRISMPY